jgi:Glycosyl transferase family group 2
MHLAYPETASTTLYAAPIIFDRNAHLVPGIVKMADILWCAAGLSGQYRSSTICPPTSVYSIPLELADRVVGWDAGPEAIGEDLHMYLKCFFALNGHLTTRTVSSPVSQTNVTGNGDTGILGYVQGLQARYKQALRHMWGSLDSGYAMLKAAELWQRRKHPLGMCRPLHVSVSSSSRDVSFESQLHVDAFLEQQMERGDFSEVVQLTLKPPNWVNVFLLFHRLFEAHFLPTHMLILVVASSIYRSLTPTDSFCIAWTFVATDFLRAVGLIALLVYFYSYQKYHRICVDTRHNEMVAAGLADRMRGSFSHRSWKDVMDCIWIPLVAPFYGSIPAIHAQLSHFGTLDLVYVVSSKPMSNKAGSE